MVNLISLKCPECGGALTIEEGRQQCFCSFCGAKIMIRNENEYTYRTIDESRIREAEAMAQVRLKELELKERELLEKEKRIEGSRNFFKKRLLVYVILSVVGCCGGFGLEKVNDSISTGLLVMGEIGVFLAFYGSVLHLILIIRAKK